MLSTREAEKLVSGGPLHVVGERGPRLRETRRVRWCRSRAERGAGDGRVCVVTALGDVGFAFTIWGADAIDLEFLTYWLVGL